MAYAIIIRYYRRRRFHPGGDPIAYIRKNFAGHLQCAADYYRSVAIRPECRSVRRHYRWCGTDDGTKGARVGRRTGESDSWTGFRFYRFGGLGGMVGGSFIKNRSTAMLAVLFLLYAAVCRFLQRGEFFRR